MDVVTVSRDKAKVSCFARRELTVSRVTHDASRLDASVGLRLCGFSGARCEPIHIKELESLAG